MASITSQTVHTGNTVSIRIKNYEVGRAQSLTTDKDLGVEAEYEIGNYMPVEHVHTRFDGTLTLNRMRLKKDDLTTVGFAPYGADALDAALFDIIVQDKQTGAIIEAYIGCTIQSYNTEYRANEIVSETATFKYLTGSKG
jgi:hypothetical protein